MLHKLNHHTTEFGVTDAIVIHENLLLASGYDLDNGVGYVNGEFKFSVVKDKVFSLTQENLLSCVSPLQCGVCAMKRT